MGDREKRRGRSYGRRDEIVKDLTKMYDGVLVLIGRILS